MLDAKLILSEDQADVLAVDVWEATNVIDVGAYETALGEEEHLRLRVEVSETLTSAGAATLTVRGMTDTDAVLEGSTVWFTTPAIALATLKAGYLVIDIGLPTVHKRYIGIVYEVAAADFTGGKLNAYVYAR